MQTFKYTKKFVTWLTVKRYHKHKMKCAVIIQMFYCKQWKWTYSGTIVNVALCKRESQRKWEKNWCYQDYHYISSLCSFWQHEWTLKQKHNLSEAYIAVFNCWRMFVQFDTKGQYLILLNLQETMRLFELR